MTASLDGRRAAPQEPAVTLDTATDLLPRAPHVSIILPCYNEEGHVAAEVARICAAMDASGYRYELIAYDDASTDDTLARLYQAAPRFPRLEIVPFRRNGGSGTIRRIGTQRARGEIVVWTDADMTYPNERIPELVQMLEKDPDVDQVVGARPASRAVTSCCGYRPSGSYASWRKGSPTPRSPT